MPNWTDAIPTIATALGGPFAGLAAGFIASKLGVSDKTVENVTQLIQGAPPEQMVKLKELDIELQKYLAELGIRQFEAEVADKNSARQREVQIAQASPAPWWMPNFVSFLTLIVVVGGGYLFFSVKETDVRYALIGIITMVLTYYYGTTKHSGEKDANIARIALGAGK